ncbi:MAG: YebC/PmpR family DNA-binding transcriptional regulator [Deltaproteobacteria bacterium]|nr:YebC/PmpR family DNA-binding transcriptional regulator [Deltaproteobacteria bacterium]MBW1952983.1 YebC/PmpR family DNA-binding transcriptional regulator [Deltaproteobacteria bacterium]MBW1985958.1 YebC/PmpR family DNA-binding transcriptional regulator [Deltaproteobacteria bacterium]MBW2133718.1 YebC/PmpR family DNA-binding transcriptional regulator [Deltaproteobacteria bacterium]
MSGHSKWSTIKRRKGAQDAKRGKIFSKLIKEITVAARLGGGDPTGNPRLRAAIEAAKAENMPKDNIDRAIKKGTGELEGSSYEEVIYEGYGPAGVAMLVESLTDNKNRTVSDIRYLFSKYGGSMGEAGCVSWMFDKKGVIVFDKASVNEDELLEAALEAGADDLQEGESELEVLTEPGNFEAVKKALEDKGFNYLLAEIQMHPKSTVRIEEEKSAQQVLKLMEMLEDHDDVQHVFANFDIPDQIIEALG